MARLSLIPTFPLFLEKKLLRSIGYYDATVAYHLVLLVPLVL
jgi:hypothetical protein